MEKNVSSVYLGVVDDVVDKMRDAFVDGAGDDSVLGELQALWELKLMRSGVVQGPVERTSAQSGTRVWNPVHDLNVLPYEGTGDYETPTAEILFPPTPLQTPMQTPLPMEPGQYQYSPSVQGEHAITPDAVVNAKSEKALFKQPSTTSINQRPPGVDVYIAYEESRAEEGGEFSESQPLTEDFLMMRPSKRKRVEYPSQFLADGYIPQQDGSGDTSLEMEFPVHEKNPAAKNLYSDSCIAASIGKLTSQKRKKADTSNAFMVYSKQVDLTIPLGDGFNKYI